MQIEKYLNKVHCGDCLEFIKKLSDNCIDAIVTDPPYELGFMGKKWDKTGIAYNVDLWRECLRILKAGGHLLAFGGTRTYHRMACAIEDAGFEIRDQLQWIYASGFPKSLNISKAVDKKFGAKREIVGKYIAPDGKERGGISKNPVDISNYRKSCRLPHNLTKSSTLQAKQWDGWGTALKPAHEPICMARKPLAEKNVCDNVLKYGTGGINIDACRIKIDKNNENSNIKRIDKTYKANSSLFGNANKPTTFNCYSKGRFPSNIILSHHPECKEIGVKEVKLNGSGKCSGNTDGSKSMFGLKGHKVSYASSNGKETVANYECHPDCAVKILDEQSGILKSGNIKPHKQNLSDEIFQKNTSKICTSINNGDTGTASRFFYCAKTSKTERNNGCENLEHKTRQQDGNIENWDLSDGKVRARMVTNPQGNHHPTVKPKKLMEYLIKLVTPKKGVVLDCFAGSGSTLIACKSLGFNFIGIEKEFKYCDIANARIEAERRQLKLPISI